MGVHGFSQSLAKEGEKNNIKVNTICPFAGTRMTETVFPKEVVDKIKPEFVAPLVLVLAHDTCPDNGALFEVGAGYVAKMRWQRTAGLLLPTEKLTPEVLSQNWSQIVDFEKNPTYPTGTTEMMEIISRSIESGKTAGEGLKADEIFGMMYTYLAQGLGKDLPAKIAAIYGFEITKTKGGKVEVVYEIDLKNGQGNVKKGKPENPDATFTMTDADFEAVCLGKLNP